MFDTVAQIAFAVTLILPGFLVVQLSERRRPATPTGGDLELILRGLVYALLIQSIGILVQWLPDLADQLSGGNWKEHLDAAAVYALVVCILAPTLLGLGLGSLLGSAESKGSLKWWHYALGGRDARRAWDFTFSRNNGAWMRIYFKDAPPGAPPAMIGIYGKSSWASQAPADPDLYLQEAWLTEADGRIGEDALATGGLGAIWISGSEIARLEVLPNNAT